MMMNQAFQGNNKYKNGASAMKPTSPLNNPDIIIIGGIGNSCLWDRQMPIDLNTVEKYNITEGKSTLLPQLNHPRVGSASCVYNNDILVVGGYSGKQVTDIEILKMYEQPLRWTVFDGKLPFKLTGFDIIVYKEKLYTIGGYDWGVQRVSNAIYEIPLTPPYTPNLLTRMTGPRKNHRAELVNGKLFILGGTTTGFNKDAIDTVVVYDLEKNEFKSCPSLPKAVSRMSTVTWDNMIIVVGGQDRNGQATNDVIMYDSETGCSERLPSMILKRSGCSSVIVDDVIFVFGGWDAKERYLNSVESFTIGEDSWKVKPQMKERRNLASAVVKPL